MADFRLISIDQPRAWDEALARCGPIDTYHLAGFHRVARDQGEGEPVLLCFEHHGHAAALPILIRRIDRVEGLEDCDHRDAGSAYGYPGVVSSVGQHAAEADRFRERFQEALREALNRLGVVSLFTRQNPLLGTTWLLVPMAAVTRVGPTVVINLAQPEEDQWREFRSNHRRDIRRSREEGLVVHEDHSFSRIGEFCRLYYETMDRAGASDYYYFGKSYFAGLKEHLGDHVRLLLSKRDGQVISGALFLLNDSIIQYHLGGTASRFQDGRGAIKLIFDEMRLWGSRHGFRWLHLGGGLGACEDSLFHFKTGFSKRLCQFETAGLVLQPEVCTELVRRRQQWQQAHGWQVTSDSCFPEYRRPAVRRAA